MNAPVDVTFVRHHIIQFRSFGQQILCGVYLGKKGIAFDRTIDPVDQKLGTLRVVYRFRIEFRTSNNKDVLDMGQSTQMFQCSIQRIKIVDVLRRGTKIRFGTERVHGCNANVDPVRQWFTIQTFKGFSPHDDRVYRGFVDALTGNVFEIFHIGFVTPRQATIDAYTAFAGGGGDDDESRLGHK